MTSGGLLAALPPGAEIDGWPVGRLVAGPRALSAFPNPPRGLTP